MVKEVTIIPKRLTIVATTVLKYGQPLFDFLTMRDGLVSAFPQVFGFVTS